MGDVNASDRIINIFSNNVIVYKQSTSLGQGPWQWWCNGKHQGLDSSSDFFSSLNWQLSFFTANTKSNPKAMTGMKCRTGSSTEGSLETQETPCWREDVTGAAAPVSPVWPHSIPISIAITIPSHPIPKPRRHGCWWAFLTLLRGLELSRIKPRHP